MNRQQIDAIAQATRYRLENMWSPAESSADTAHVRSFRQGFHVAKDAALVSILSFADPPPDDWEGYG